MTKSELIEKMMLENPDYTIKDFLIRWANLEKMRLRFVSVKK